MHQCETDLIADRVEAPNLGDGYLNLLGEPACHFHSVRGNVEVKRQAAPPEMRPLGHRFEVVDRFVRLHLDDTHHLAPCGEDQVGVEDECAGADTRVFLVPDVGRHVVLSLQLCLKMTDDTIVFELLSDGSDQDRHSASGGIGWRISAIYHKPNRFRQ